MNAYKTPALTNEMQPVSYVFTNNDLCILNRINQLYYLFSMKINKSGDDQIKCIQRVILLQCM